MGFVLDDIIKIDLELGATVDANYTSNFTDIGGAEGGFAIVVEYSNGNGSVDMLWQVELSVDGTNYAPVTETNTTITDDSGSITWDILGSNATFVRVVSTHTDGSMDVAIRLTAKRRH